MNQEYKMWNLWVEIHNDYPAFSISKSRPYYWLSDDEKIKIQRIFGILIFVKLNTQTKQIGLLE